jgi:hypothetical protein
MNNYFSHDSNARNDERLIRLRMKHRAAGYGVYFMILERMREEKNYMCIKDYNVIAFDLREDVELIRSVVEDFDLFCFTDDGKQFYSESFIKRMHVKDAISSKRSEAGKKGARRRYLPNNSQGDDNTEDGNCLANATEEDSKCSANEGVLKKRKEKKSKVNNTSIIKNNNKAKQDEVLSNEERAQSCLDCWNSLIEQCRKNDIEVCLKPAEKLTDYRIHAFDVLAQTYSGKEVGRAFRNAMGNAFCNGRTKERTRAVQLDWLIDPQHPERFISLLENTM